MSQLLSLLGIYLSAAILCSIAPVSNRLASYINTIAFTSAFGLTLALYFTGTSYFFEIQWFESASNPFYLNFQIYPKQLPLLLFTTLTAALVAIYSSVYFDSKTSNIRFFQTLGFFMFSMMGLLLSANLFLTFIFWELVGLSSYLLIGYYRESREAGPAALKAMLLNKTGDAAFLIGLLLCWNIFGSFNLNTLSTASTSDGTLGLFLGLTIFFAITAKSAQVPLHGWLADAMAGPTPVSALIHSATMVAAGIFLLGQYPVLFNAQVREIIGFTGMITALLAGWNALSQVKIKRLLAWSTMSQLGLMVMTAGWSSDSAAGLHLMVHGLAKAGLFLVAGILLTSSHGLSNPDNDFGDLKSPDFGNSLSRTGIISLLVLSASLAGLPLTNGFISKENIASGFSGFALVVFLIINLMTLLYLARLLWFIQPLKNFSQRIAFSKRDVSPMILAITSLWITFSIYPSGAPNYFQIEILSGNLNAYLSLIVLLTGIFIIIFLWRRAYLDKLDAYTPPFYPETYYQRVLTQFVLRLSSVTNFTDHKLIDGIAHGKAYFVVMSSHLTTFLDKYVLDFIMALPARAGKIAASVFRAPLSGQISVYLWWSIFGILVLIIVYF